MPTKSASKIYGELRKRAYFRLWQIQNDPNYISYYKKCVKEDNAAELIDPFKKYDWKALSDSGDAGFDLIIILNRIFSFVSGIEPTNTRRALDNKKLFANFRVDLRKNKKGILTALSSEIDRLRGARKIKPHPLDYLDKFPLYAEVWDMRKQPGRKSFTEIAAMLGKSVSTIKKRYYKAYKLLYGKPYDPTLRRSMRKETLPRDCDTCVDRKTCRVPCREIMPFINQDQRKYLRETLKGWLNLPEKATFEP